MTTGQDLSGMQFGELRAVRIVGSDHFGNRLWLCECSCGKSTTVSATNLGLGRIKACGHNIGKSNKIDLTGMRFGRLVVIKDAGRARNRDVRWLCQCDCGNTKVISASNLKNGNSTTCGCGWMEAIATAGGLSATPEYYRARGNRRREKKLALDSEWTREMEMSLRSFFQSCVACGSADRLETDHAMPLNGGNGLQPGNAIRLCRRCNASKGFKNLDEISEDIRNKISSAAAEFGRFWYANH